MTVGTVLIVTFCDSGDGSHCHIQTSRKKMTTRTVPVVIFADQKERTAWEQRVI